MRFFEKTLAKEYCGPGKFVNWLQENFEQIEEQEERCVAVIWTRSKSNSYSKIKISDLKSKKSGYPFDLVIEHAFVLLDGYKIFQKRDPLPTSEDEETSFYEGISPYKNKLGFEITYHRLFAIKNS